jgi:hypothetical protein
VLACRSPELFVAQAWEFTRSGIVNSGDCVQFEDTPFSVEENRYRIQTSNDEYVCIHLSFSHSAPGRRQQVFSILAKVLSFLRHNFLR